jgi:hypothetical protein
VPKRKTNENQIGRVVRIPFQQLLLIDDGDSQTDSVKMNVSHSFFWRHDATQQTYPYLFQTTRKALVVGNVFGVIIMAKEVFVTLSLLQI